MKTSNPVPKTVFAFNKKALFQAQNQDIIRDFKELKGILFDARGCYKLWWAYLQMINDPDRFPTVLKFKDFFQTSAYAYNCNLIISLHKLYDGGRDVLNIQAFLNELINRKILDAMDQANMKPLLDEVKIIWKKVVILRSNLFAHRKNTLSRNEIYKIAQITPNQLRDLTDKSLKILNLAAEKLYETNEQFRDLEESDMQNLLAVLKRSCYDSASK